MDLSAWKHFKRHPLSEVWGEMSDVEFEGLLADMKQHGYDNKQQIWLYEGMILDGWHRHSAAVHLNLKQAPTYEVYKGADPQGFVTRRNLLRRHLDVSQRALIAGKIANLGHGGDRKSDDQEPKTSLEKAAADMNVGLTSAKAGKQVAELGSPTLQKAVAEGIVSVTDAAQIVDEIASVQNKAVSSVRRGLSKTVRGAVSGKTRKPKPPPSEMELHSKQFVKIEELMGAEYKDEDAMWKRVKKVLGELQKLRDERPHGGPGVIKCPTCNGFGQLDKKVQDDLFDAVAKVTGADKKVAAGHIIKVCKTLLAAEPAYTPDEVLGLPGAVKKRGMTFTLTVGCLPKYIGWVRQEVKEKRNGRTSRIEAPAGKYDRVGVVAGPPKAASKS